MLIQTHTQICTSLQAHKHTDTCRLTLYDIREHIHTTYEEIHRPMGVGIDRYILSQTQTYIQMDTHVFGHMQMQIHGLPGWR